MADLTSEAVIDRAEAFLRRIWGDLNTWADDAHQRGDRLEHSALCVAASEVNEALNGYRRRRLDEERRNARKEKARG